MSIFWKISAFCIEKDSLALNFKVQSFWAISSLEQKNYKEYSRSEWFNVFCTKSYLNASKFIYTRSPPVRILHNSQIEVFVAKNHQIGLGHQKILLILDGKFLFLCIEWSWNCHLWQFWLYFYHLRMDFWWNCHISFWLFVTLSSTVQWNQFGRTLP